MLTLTDGVFGCSGCHIASRLHDLLIDLHESAITTSGFSEDFKIHPHIALPQCL